MRAAIIPLLTLTVLVASAAPVPVGSERVAVINLQLEGGPKFESVILLTPPRLTLMLHVCIREYDAQAIRCYALDVADPKKPVWLTLDIDLKN